jgi:hypothetical protein
MMRYCPCPYCQKSTHRRYRRNTDSELRRAERDWQGRNITLDDYNHVRRREGLEIIVDCEHCGMLHEANDEGVDVEACTRCGAERGCPLQGAVCPCGIVFCEPCNQRETSICEDCQEIMCEDCWGATCTLCECSLCKECVNWCEECDKYFCSKCRDHDCAPKEEML